MSILVALTGANCGVTATDGKRIEVDGRDDFPKCLHHGPSLFGGTWACWKSTTSP
jgi:hypothetical protein